MRFTSQSLVSYFLLCACVTMTACSSGTQSAKAPVPATPSIKIGKPYVVDGQTYTPQYEPMYDEIGTASWYGPGFHGKFTANGEVFNQNDLTAAHATLPLPCLVRVTNLQNGKSLIVRVNDRGPFKDKRLIDLSKESARQLGVTGLAKVRVQFLKEESEQYWASHKLDQPPEMLLAQARAPLTAKGGNNVINTTDSAEIKSTAPIMTVMSNDLTAPQNASAPAVVQTSSVQVASNQPVELKNLKVRPLQPTFKVINDAQASELPSAEIASTPAEPIEKITNINNANEPVHEADHAEKPANTPQNVKPLMPAEKVAPAKKSLAGDASLTKGWYVQVGAFASAENANALVTKLKAYGEPQINDLTLQSGVLHRVRVGPLAQREEAERLRVQVASLGIRDARVVKE